MSVNPDASDTPIAITASTQWLGVDLSYGGVKTLHTKSGTVDVLVFTASHMTMTDLTQTAIEPSGTLHQAIGGQASFDGHVTLYVESLEGDAFGILHMKLDPQHEPALVPPILEFTNLKVTLRALSCDSATFPALSTRMT
jgi:hypothetical protein